MTFASRWLFLLASLAAMVLGASGARAAGYPEQTVRIVVPFSAGSMTDILARALADRLQMRWKQYVIVENRVGIPGAASVAKAPADGSILLFTSNGHVVLGAVNKALNFDPIADFEPIAKVADTPSILIAPAAGTIDTLQKLIAEVRARPNELSYASAGVASSTGIAAELFKSITGAQLSMVAYRGLPEANTSILRADTAMGFTFFNVGGDLIQAGNLRALAVSGPKRMQQLPDVPTFAEAGLAEFNYDAWFGLFAPTGTPKHVVDQIARDVTQEIVAGKFDTLFQPQGVAFHMLPPAEFAQIVSSDAERYRQLVRQGTSR